MSYNITDDIIFLAKNHGYKFIPAAGIGKKWAGYDEGKQPLISIHDASSDPQQITAWADKYYGCNWLMVPDYGHAILDVDPRHGADKLLAELEEKHGKLPVTARVKTGGG